MNELTNWDRSEAWPPIEIGRPEDEDEVMLVEKGRDGWEEARIRDKGQQYR